MLIRLLRLYLKPYWGTVAVIAFLQLAQVLASLYLPSLNADIIDGGVAKGNIGYIWSTGGFMLGVTFVQVLCSIVAVYLAARISMKFGRDVRAGIFRKVETFSAQEMSKFGAPSLITRNTNDVQQVQMLVFMSSVFLLAAPMMMIGGVIMAMRQDLELTWILTVIIPVLLVVVILVVRRLMPLFQGVQERIDRINGVLREQITGIRVIRAFIRRDYEEERFAGANLDLTRISISVGRTMAFLFPAIMLVMNLSQVSVMWFGGHRIGDGTMEVGGLTAFLNYIMQILISVMMASMMFMFIPRAAVCAQRICEVLDTLATVRDPEVPSDKDPVGGVVELREADFRYPGAEEPVLHDVTLRAEPGQTTAIIGSTGSGKTTLLNLIPRFYDVTDGQVFVGGVDVRELSQEVLWSKIGLVPQRPYLFSGTIASNLRYGNADATDEELWEALDIAQARHFVEEMPEQLNSPISQGGTNVSGGQRQRLAMARALVKKPDVYLFDDSFSALDFTTDARLREALVPVTQAATIIIVAQRVSTILHADSIVVLDQGAIVGQGRHEELMDDCPTYREIVLSQMSVEEAV